MSDANHDNAIRQADDGMSGVNHDNAIRQADDERMRSLRQTIMGTYGILNGKPEGNKTL
jgi:hypothetical protein